MTLPAVSLPFRTALVRRPGPDSGSGLTTSTLGPPDIPLLLRQHRRYVDELAALGLEIIELPPAPGFPDAYFVEDAAVVLPGAAVLTRPGALSRRGEIDSIAAALAPRKPILRIEAPGTLEGGDVLRLGDRYFIGLSARTNEAGARQLGRFLEAQGFSWGTVAVDGGLHLKSGVNALGDDAVVLASGFAGLPAFRPYRRTVLGPGEDYAANVLIINGALLMPAGFPEARLAFAPLGYPIREIDVSEARKMDGGLTCMSLRF